MNEYYFRLGISPGETAATIRRVFDSRLNCMIPKASAATACSFSKSWSGVITRYQIPSGANVTVSRPRFKAPGTPMQWLANRLPIAFADYRNLASPARSGHF
jgi:hypothetical protein